MAKKISWRIGGFFK